jgi:hypothetical protein
VAVRGAAPLDAQQEASAAFEQRTGWRLVISQRG